MCGDLVLVCMSGALFDDHPGDRALEEIINPWSRHLHARYYSARNRQFASGSRQYAKNLQLEIRGQKPPRFAQVLVLIGSRIPRKVDCNENVGSRYFAEAASS